MAYSGEQLPSLSFQEADSRIRKTRTALLQQIGGGTRQLTSDICAGVPTLANTINSVTADETPWLLTEALGDLEGFIRNNSGGNTQLVQETMAAPYGALVGRSLETITTGKAEYLTRIIDLATGKKLPLAEMAQAYARLAGNTKLQPSDYVLALPMVENITAATHAITTENTNDIAALGDFFAAMGTITTRLDERGEQFSAGLIEHLDRFIERDGALAQNIPINGKDRNYASLVEYSDSLKKQKERSAIVMKTQTALQRAQEVGLESREPVMLQLMNDLENSRNKAGIFCVTFYPDSDGKNTQDRVIMLKPMEAEGTLTLKPLEKGVESPDESTWKIIQTNNIVCYLLTRNGILAYTVTHIPEEQLERPDLISYKAKLIQQNSFASPADTRAVEAFTKAVHDGGSLTDEQDKSIFAKRQFSRAATYVYEEGDGVIADNGNADITGGYFESAEMNTAAYSSDQLCQVANPQLFVKALEKSLA